MFNDDQADLPAPWQWPGLWTLNLPVLVVVWQLLFAHGFHVWLKPYHSFTTAALAWAFLATERWIFFFRLRPDLTARMMEARDREEQAWMMVRICLLIATGLVLLGLLRAHPRELAGMLIWTSLGGSYLVALRHAPDFTSELLPREIVLPAYLAGTAALFVWANSVLAPMNLLLPVLLLLLLFFYYFCLVGGWGERLLPEPAASLETGSLGLFYRRAPLLLLFVAAALVLVFPEIGAPQLILTIGVSGLILLLLDLWQDALSRRVSRILADIALLVPLIPLLIG